MCLIMKVCKNSYFSKLTTCYVIKLNIYNKIVCIVFLIENMRNTIRKIRVIYRAKYRCKEAKGVIANSQI